MASRAELKQICYQLYIPIEDYERLSIDELTLLVRKKLDKKFTKKPYRIGAKWLSIAMVKFLTEEYDYILKDKVGRKYSYHDLLREDKND